MKKPEPVICPYCDRKAELVGGNVIYPHRPDLARKRFYRCDPCAAWVGCHNGTTTPLGRLANGQLRAAKERAHATFDRLWMAKMHREGVTKNNARRAAYAWLSAQMKIPPKETHIGMFDLAQCRRVVVICSPYLIGAAA